MSKISNKEIDINNVSMDDLFGRAIPESSVPKVPVSEQEDTLGNSLDKLNLEQKKPVIDYESDDEIVSHSTEEEVVINNPDGLSDPTPENEGENPTPDTDFNSLNAFLIEAEEDTRLTPEKLEVEKEITETEIIDEESNRVDTDDREMFSNMYDKVNDDILGKRDNIKEGYPMIALHISADKPMTKRELRSLQRILLDTSYTDQIEEKQLLRLKLVVDQKHERNENIIGYISPHSVKILMLNMRSHRIVGYYNEKTVLEDKKILALYKR